MIPTNRCKHTCLPIDRIELCYVTAIQNARCGERLEAEDSITTAGEGDGRSQAGDLLVILGDNIGKDGVFPGRDLGGQVDILCERHDALLKRAVEVDILDGVAQVCGLADDRDQAVLDLQPDLCPLFNVLLELALGGDCECGATAGISQTDVFESGGQKDLRLRRVR